MAAVTSLISIVEVPAAYFIDEKKMSRRKAVIIAGIGAFVAGVPAALSIGSVDWLTNLVVIRGQTMGFLDVMNLVFGQYSLIIGSLGVAIFVGWKWGVASVNSEISEGYPGFKGQKIYGFFIRFMAPIAVAALLICLILFPDAF